LKVKFGGDPGGADGISRYAENLRVYLAAQGIPLFNSDYDVAHAVQPVSGEDVDVVTCHDLAPLRDDTEKQRGMKNFVFERIFKKRCEQSFRKAKFIICNSSLTADDVVHFFGYPEKVRTIPMGISKSFRPMRLDRPTGIRVGCCTRSMWRAEAVVKMIPESSLIPLKGVPLAEVAEYYNRLDVFFHCSTNEGFGYPILEAQACGIPVVVFKDARIPEEVTMYAMKAEDEEDARDKLLNHGSVPIRKAEEYARRFTVDRMGSETVSLYEQVMEEFPRPH
jgi:hypothetical protein